MSTNFIVNIEVIVEKDGKFLFGRRSEKEDHAAGKVSLIGGKVETDSAELDIIEKTAVREVREEVDIEIGPNIEYVSSETFIADDKELVLDIMVKGSYISGEAKVMIEEELSEVIWLSYDEVMSHPDIIQPTKRVFEKMQTNRFPHSRG